MKPIASTKNLFCTFSCFSPSDLYTHISRLQIFKKYSPAEYLPTSLQSILQTELLFIGIIATTSQNYQFMRQHLSLRPIATFALSLMNVFLSQN